MEGNKNSSSTGSVNVNINQVSATGTTTTTQLHQTLMTCAQQICMRSALKVVNVVISTSMGSGSNESNESKEKSAISNPIDALGGSFAFLEYLNVVFTRHLSVGKAWDELEEGKFGSLDL